MRPTLDEIDYLRVRVAELEATVASLQLELAAERPLSSTSGSRDGSADGSTRNLSPRSAYPRYARASSGASAFLRRGSAATIVAADFKTAHATMRARALDGEEADARTAARRLAIDQRMHKHLLARKEEPALIDHLFALAQPGIERSHLRRYRRIHGLSTRKQREATEWQRCSTALREHSRVYSNVKLNRRKRGGAGLAGGSVRVHPALISPLTSPRAPLRVASSVVEEPLSLRDQIRLELTSTVSDRAESEREHASFRRADLRVEAARDIVSGGGRAASFVSGDWLIHAWTDVFRRTDQFTRWAKTLWYARTKEQKDEQAVLWANEVRLKREAVELDVAKHAARGRAGEKKG